MHCNSVFKYTCFNCNYSKSKEAKYYERAAFFCDRCAFKTAVGHIYIDVCVLLSSANNSNVQHANWGFFLDNSKSYYWEITPVCHKVHSESWKIQLSKLFYIMLS